MHKPLKNNRHNKTSPGIIAVIGHLVWDRIIKPDGDKTEAPGGIAYSLSALGLIAGDDIRVLPVLNVGSDLYETAKTIFKRFPAIDFSYVREIDRVNKVHELQYRTEEYRREINIGEMPKISPSLFRKIKHIDVALINYIGGDEFPPSSIRWLKETYDPLIYMDYHSLALGRIKIPGKGLKKVKRHFRYNPHWREYTGLADIVQMNDIELQSIFPESSDDTESLIKIARCVHHTGPKLVIITREENALIVVEGRKSNPQVHILDVDPANVVDPTGCGDCLGAGFIVSYLKNGNLLDACKNGLNLASKKAGFSGLDGFSSLI